MIQKSIGILADQIRGVSYKKKNLHDTLDENSVILLRANNIINGKLDFTDVLYVDKSVISDTQYLKYGDILISASSGSKKVIGKAASFHSQCKCTFGAFCKVIRPHKDVREFLRIYFQSSAYRRQISHLALGANINNIRNEHIDSLQLEIPNETARKQIVNKIDLLQKILTKKQQILSDLDELIKARFVEMFGDPVLNPNNYELIKLSDLGALNRGKSKHRPRNDPKLLGGPYPLIQTGDITNSDIFIRKYNSTYSKFGLEQSKMWPEGTFCITIAANIAQTAILSFNACFPDSVVGFIPNSDRITTIYLHYWFSFYQKILDTQASQVAQKNINLKVLSNLDIAVPPKAEQDNFLSFVQQVDKSKVAVQKSLKETQTLFDSLMQKYFS